MTKEGELSLLDIYLDKKIFLFGSGEMMKNLYTKINIEKIEGIIDNDQKKWGSSFKHHIIHSPKILSDYNKKEILIIIASMYYDEISKQLISLGFDEIDNFIDGNEINVEYLQLTNFKNKHKNKRAFIIGNGPSLKIEDLELLKDEITFAANKIYLAFQDTDWRPTYYFVEDTLVAKNNALDIAKLDLIKFISKNNKEYFKDIEINGEIYWINQKGLIVRDSVIEYKFSEDFAIGFFGGWTVIYMMLQAAYYMGIDEIFLIGIDFSFNLEDKSLLQKAGVPIMHSGEINHFHANYRSPGELWFSPALDKQLRTFNFSKKFFEKKGINIYNVSRKTKLKVFERCSLKDIL